MREVRLQSARRGALWGAHRGAKALAVNAWAKRRPLWRGWGEAFNGQRYRARAIDRLIAEFEPDTLIETGTHHGFTTRHLATQGLPVFTIELDPGHKILARRRLRGLSNVTLVHGDSAEALAWIATAPRVRRPMLYLDAHSDSDLPLDDELRVSFAAWPDLAVVIDDFRVDGDPSYRHWTYRGTPLALEHLSLPDDVLAAFPAEPGSSETGSQKGAVYIGRGEGSRAIARLCDSGTLTRAAATP